MDGKVMVLKENLSVDPPLDDDVLTTLNFRPENRSRRDAAGRPVRLLNGHEEILPCDARSSVSAGALLPGLPDDPVTDRI
jgi:hypothetical protein